MENIIISKEFLDWYDYYKECKEKYSSLVNDVENKMICGKYKDIKLPFSNMNTNNLNRDISSLEKIQVLMMQGSTSQINVEIELVKEKMFESCWNVNFGILCNPLASTLYRMILDSSRVKKHIEDVSKRCKENDFYTSVFIPVYLRHFYASICEECIKGYSSYEFVQSVDSLIEEDKFSEACSFCPIYEEIYIQANEKGLLSKELIQVMQQYGVNVFSYLSWGPIDIVSSSSAEMSKRYGYVYVDYDDFGKGTGKRMKKDSFYWYKHVIETNGEEL